MKKWYATDNYLGQDMSEYYILYSVTRDSGILDRANFDSILEEIGGESDSVQVHHFGHWACGWIDAIMIHKSDVAMVAKGKDIQAQLSVYSVFNAQVYYDMVYHAAVEYWEYMSITERIQLCSDADISIFAARRDTPDVDLIECLEEAVER